MDTITENFKSLYVHFPFCESKCHYCDFFSLPEGQVAEKQQARIYEAILKELDLYSRSIAVPLKTVFLGGGTPSLVPLETMERFIKKLPIDAKTEVTMEANPSSITPERAKAWVKFGINRVSMGVQALNDDRLKWLGRVHSKSEVFEALEALFQGGIRRVSIDYIVGVPDQSCEVIAKELAEALERFPHIQHVSAYLLTLKGSNPKFQQLPNEDEQLAHLRTVSNVLKGFGFEQYEISNFARTEARALHNENYWLGGSYLGIGPSAHSFWPSANKRTKNWASLGKYADLIEAGTQPVEWEETLDLEQTRLEYLMLRMRRADGIDLQEYQRLFGRNLMKENAAKIESWRDKGLCSLSDRLRLTADGFFLSDQILSKIV
jgi:oxygen-independent coproporphyrinogen-3 oxidase